MITLLTIKAKITLFTLRKLDYTLNTTFITYTLLFKREPDINEQLK